MNGYANVIEFYNKTSPQKENGYTSIAHELMDALAKFPLPGAQMQCLLFILRKTYGFHKKADHISLSQFSKGTGIPRRNVARAIDQLKQKNIINVKKCSVKYDTTTTSIYSLNKDYSSWIGGVKIDTGSVKRGKNVVSNMTPTKDIYTKDNIPHRDAELFYTTKKKRKLNGKRFDAFNLFWLAFNYKKDKASAADAWLDIPELTNALVDRIIIAAEAEAANRKTIIDRGLTPIYAQGWLSGRRWEDEAYSEAPQQKISVFKVEDHD